VIVIGFTTFAVSSIFVRASSTARRRPSYSVRKERPDPGIKLGHGIGIDARRFLIPTKKPPLFVANIHRFSKHIRSIQPFNCQRAWGAPCGRVFRPTSVLLQV
jgi:hypothetical protein